MRIKHIVNVFVSEDSSEKDVLFGNKDTTLALQQLDGFERVASGNLSIAATVTESVPTGDVDAIRGVYVEADSDFDVVFNGGGDTLQMRKADTDPSRKVKMFLEGVFTSIDITNISSTTTLKGKYCVWGDPTP